MTIKERILILAKAKGFAVESFCKEIGMTYGNFKGKAKNTPINSNTIVNIFTIFPDLNLEWLLTGNGQMLIDEQGIVSKSHAPPDICSECEKKDMLIESLQAHNTTLQKMVTMLEGQKKPEKNDGQKRKAS